MQIEDSPAAGTYTAVGSQRQSSIQLNNRPVDVSNKDTAAGFTEWDTASSLKEYVVPIEGIVDDASSAYTELKDMAEASDPSANFRILRGTGAGYYEGAFVIESFQEDAPHDGPVTYQASLRNKGDITFVP